MEQIGDIIERILQDVEDKKIRKSRSFSDAGMAEICHLHERLMANLRLGMSVFLDGHVREAQKLLEEKARFRDLEHEYAASHISRLRDNTAQSIETSSLHLDLISDLKRINSHICSIAYPILESAGALSRTRVRETLPLATWLGVIGISAGVLIVGLSRGAGNAVAHGHALRFALMNAVIIAAYTVVDGIGVRASGNALQYVAVLFLLNGLPFFALV